MNNETIGLVLTAGGTWQWVKFLENASSGVVSYFFQGISTGGTTLTSGVGGMLAKAWVWRIT